jgi:DNA-binding CsgD family transcriptional regulator
LESALATFQNLEARPWANRARRELQATTQVKHRSDGHHLDASLTPQEHQIATLASHGLTNQQIAAQLLISPRTVAAHLQRAYRKLAVSSRGGLHQALTSRTLYSLPKADHD